MGSFVMPSFIIAAYGSLYRHFCFYHWIGCCGDDCGNYGECSRFDTYDPANKQLPGVFLQKLSPQSKEVSEVDEVNFGKFKALEQTASISDGIVTGKEEIIHQPYFCRSQFLVISELTAIL